MRIGAQFYTIRDFCKDTDSLAQSLKKVADIGYEFVQISGTCDYDANWLKSELDKNGLKCVLTHYNADKMVADPKAVAEFHQVFDCKNIGLGYGKFAGETSEQLEQDITSFKTKFLPVAETFRDNGAYFMYHNHDHEFKKCNGKTVLEHLADVLPADAFGFTLDTYWVQAGGADPAAYIEKFAGRLPCIHLKDMAYGKQMAVVGEGNINFDRVFAAAEKAGTQYMLVEQDNCNGEDPFECLKRSYNNLVAYGWR